MSEVSRTKGQVVRLEDQLLRFEGLLESLRIAIKHSERNIPIGGDLAQAIVHEGARMAMTIMEHDAYQHAADDFKEYLNTRDRPRNG